MRPQESVKGDVTKIRERPLILVLDDDLDVARFLVSRLRKCSVDAIHAADGREGYALAVREKPAVIISDYSMPGGDINFLLWRVRSTPSIDKTPVFAMTGYDLDKLTTERLIRGSFGQRGVDRVFKKPLDIHEMFVAIQKCCALQYGSNDNPGQNARDDGAG
jgi:CheY-like chemotaxis protein